MDLKTILILVLLLGLIASHYQIKYLKHVIKMKNKQIKDNEYLWITNSDYDE